MRKLTFAGTSAGFAVLIVLLGFAANSCSSEATGSGNSDIAPAPLLTDYPEGGTYDISASTARFTDDLPFQLDTLWVSQSYLSQLIGIDSLKVFIEDQLVSTISDFGEEFDSATQTVALVDMVVTNPSGAEPLSLVMNGDDSQFVLRADGEYMARTKTWVEYPTPVNEVGEIDWLPFQSWFNNAGADFLQGISVTEDLVVHGRNADTGDFYESPLMLAPGETTRAWLAFFVPLDTEEMTLLYDGMEIPLVR